MPTFQVNSKLMKLLRMGALIGSPVTTFLRELCAHNPSIAEMRFRTYGLTPGLSERLVTHKDIAPRWLVAAQKAASATGVGLWDSLAASVIRKGKDLPRNVFVEALTHEHSEAERTLVLTRQEILDGRAVSIGQQTNQDEGISLCSEIRVKEGYQVHLPMLDFACNPTEANQAAISSMLVVIKQAGIILNSGNSYHFLGVSLLTGEEWARFMGHALLLAPFIDVRYIGHRLIDGECRLRVFASNKNPQTPVIEQCIC
jgi:hypothetical protein